MIDIINNPTIVAAIDSQSDDYIPGEPDSLAYTCVFPYLSIPDTQTKADTYLLMAVNVSNPNRKNSTFVDMTVVIWVMAHQKRMKMKGANSTRIDYLSKEVIEMLSGQTKYGYGTLTLYADNEKILNESYLYRELIFKVVDTTASMCGGD